MVRQTIEAARLYRKSERNKLNAVEIEEAISALAEQPFDAQEFGQPPLSGPVTMLVHRRSLL